MQFAVSTWICKSVDDEQRIIEGIASSPAADRDEDVIDPAGAIVRLPMPLLWQHKQDQPIGEILAARHTPAGWWVRGQIAKGLTQTIEDAWRLIRGGLVKGFSIGLLPKEVTPRKGQPYGLHVKTWEWLETSAVTVPSNRAASIVVIKSLDLATRAAPGAPRVDPSYPGASGRSGLPAMLNASEQITALRAQLMTKHARLGELLKLETEDGLTLSDEQQTEIDGLTGDVQGLGTKIKRLEVIEAGSALLATPANGSALDLATRSRGDGHTPRITVTDPTPPGIGFARGLICKMASYLSGGSVSALEIARARYPDDPRIPMMLKAAVLPATTTDAAWAGNLVYPTQLATEFIEYLRPQTIVGKFGQNGIPALRRVPFNVRVTGQTSGASASWVGQGLAKPVTSFATAASTLGFTKIATIAVLTDELAKYSSPSAEGMVRDELARAVIERMDMDFIDPAIAAIANVRPASILNAVTPITMAGTDADAVRAALGDLLSAYLTANNSPASAVIILPSTLALEWSLLTNALGQPEFPALSMNGGNLQGVPVITSQYALIGGNALFIMVNAGDVFLADDGGVSVDVSREATILMSNDPVADADTADHVNLWQNNMIGLRAERYVNWAKRREGAAQYISIDVTP